MNVKYDHWAQDLTEEEAHDKEPSDEVTDFQWCLIGATLAWLFIAILCVVAQ